MIDWNEALAATDSIVAEVFDRESFRVVPTARRVGVNETRMADPDRVGFPFLGSIDFGPAVLTPGFSHPSTLTSNRDRARDMPTHEAVITALSTDWPEPVRVEDHITWVAADGEVKGRFLVAAIPVDGSERLAIFVNRTKGKP
ncbi:hypothetical protein EOA88_00275 [Mesorhizobium sp. M5C.F.Ca.IN.020.14.1.1]|nr:hypothetical protein EOA88_00275 [Mesorhizobium sp. M5C.F.Ca.IN.020.14.1.1]